MNAKLQPKPCPACGSASLNAVGSLPIRDFDGSVFNFVGELWQCDHCGFGRMVSPLADETIAAHYAQDCLYSVMDGVGVGGNSKEDLVRYDYYHKILAETQLLQGHIVDCGCSRGGFLKYLQQHHSGLALTGVDVDEKSLAHLATHEITALAGNVFALPLASDSADLLCYFHVLEHVLDVDAILEEAGRVITTQGRILVEVPDAAHYGDAALRVGACFWLAMKEHVNHFTPAALEYYAAKNGLAVQAVYRGQLPMKNDHQYPSLVVVLQKQVVDQPVPIQVLDLSCTLRTHYTQEKNLLEREVADFLQFIENYQQVTFWGIGLEFFNFYAHIQQALYKLDVKLVDANPGKQGYDVDGLTIAPPTSPNQPGGLICCSHLSGESIHRAALELGWNATDIFRLSR